MASAFPTCHGFRPHPSSMPCAIGSKPARLPVFQKLRTTPFPLVAAAACSLFLARASLDSHNCQSRHHADRSSHGPERSGSVSKPRSLCYRQHHSASNPPSSARMAPSPPITFARHWNICHRQHAQCCKCHCARLHPAQAHAFLFRKLQR